MLAGAQFGIRTRDLFLTKEVLYRLSYMGNYWIRNRITSTIELSFDGAVHRRISGAGDGIRTRDINLGKVALYQLSYSRLGG